MTALPVFNPDPDLYPDPSGRAARMLAFMSRLRLWEGEHAGELLRVRPFQQAITRKIYGPTAPDGSRLVRLAACWLPRGAGKTAYAAGLALGHFLGPEAEAGGQVVMAAADRENAGIAFGHSWQMTRADDVLLSRVRPIESRKTLHHIKTASRLSAISTESYSKHGLAASFFLADEIHAWPAAEARKLFSVVRDSMVKRREPLTIIISTAGEGTGGLAWDLWSYSLKVASGEIVDPTFAPIIFAADPAAEWRDETAWRAANPAIAEGFCSIEELRTKARRIEHFPAEIADFKRYHLNVWTEGASAPWIDLGLYDAADAITPEADLIGRTCYAGIDLSSVEDLAAVVLVFRDGSGEEAGYDVLAKFFLPEASIKAKAERDKADYLRWAEQGHLVLTPGNVIDHAAIINHVVELAQRYDLREAAIDRWNSTAVNTALLNEGLNVVMFGQGFASMAAPVKELKRAILSKQFRHGGNPVLRSCFANVVADTDAAENQKFTKEKATGRIDGAVAAAMAVGRALANVGMVSLFDRPELWGNQPANLPLETSADPYAPDPAILANPRHPEFQKHRELYDRQLAMADEDF